MPQPRSAAESIIGPRRSDGRAAAASPHGGSPDEWRDRQVTVMGLGRHGGGTGAARYLVGRGAQVTISDAAPPEQLAGALAALGKLPLAGVNVGGHDPCDFRRADVVVVNPAVRPDHPLLALARQCGAELITEIELFLRACAARVVGVTGSNGKSTACGMLTRILRLAGRRAWLGGNFGGSLLDDLHGMRADDWVVLELSSFQLARLSCGAPWPRLAAVTSCTENHLDWHGSFAAYARAKQRLIVEQPEAGLAILDPGSPGLSGWQGLARGACREPWPDERVGRLRVPGAHNRRNAAHAAALAEAAGVDEATIVAALAGFAGLPHRLQRVGTAAGREFYNDSKSTTAEATAAALAALGRPVWLLAGGLAKGSSAAPLGRVIAGASRGAALFGRARHEIAEQVRAHNPRLPLHVTEHLDDALAWSWRQAGAGEAIVLSPGCASHDQYHDFAERGETYCRLVAALARGAGRSNASCQR